MMVQKDQVVRIECELRVRGGDVIESSKRSGPVEYKHGSGQLLAALEKKLEAMKVGEEKKGTIPAKEAFGAVSAATQKLPRKAFPAEAKLDVGARFEAKLTTTPVLLEVTAIDGEDIQAKVIHPLADKDLDFHVKVLSVRPPPPPVPPTLEGDLLLDDE